ncbi:MAG: efflux RND transporter periplasmic adaptor subunit [Anaerolineales bacterium]|nr:efflux RND transporter periplasmic adaptor subunit [Anaerolineales bacterium]
MTKRGKLWLALIAVVVLGGAGYYFYSQNIVSAADESGEEPAVQTAVARQGELVVSTTGAGSIVAAQEVSLAFDTNGTLTELLVQVGDSVQEGDVLARVDDMAAQEALTNAQIALSKAAMQTDASATQTGISYDDISLTNAQIALEEAQKNLDELLNWEPDEDEIAQAEASLAAAQAGYSAASGQAVATNNNLELEAMSLDDAQAAVVAAQEAYDLAFDPGREWELYTDDPSCQAGQSYPNCTGQPYSTRLANERQSAINAIARAEENLYVAQLNYESAVASSGSSSLANANSSVLNAQISLKAAQAGPTEDDIAAAQTAVRQAELSLQQVMLNVEANQLNLTQAQLNVTAAEETVAGTELVAPMDGTIMAINYDVGENVSGVMLTLANLEQPMIEAYLDESDLNMVGVGYEVDVVFDALPDDTFVGTVVLIDPQLVNESGITAVRALVELNEDSFAKPQTLPIGLNATVEVIGGRAQNAVLVPVEALREISDGQYAVFVMENGEPTLRFVEVGIMDFTYAQILSGVEAGEEVTTGIVQTQ